MKLRVVLIKLYSILFGKRTKLVSDRTFVRTLYTISFGKNPSLDAPKSFQEHVCRIKLSDNSLSYGIYTDKYEVRNYVVKTIGEKYVTPLLGVYDSFEEIPFTQLPDRFVLKATHASGYNFIVRNKNDFNIASAKKKFAKWLATNYYLIGREKNYKNIKPRIIAEEFLTFPEPITEYKLFCFYGEVRMISVHRYTQANHTATVYTPDWVRLNVKMGYLAEESLSQPESLKELLDCAQKLSAPFDFVRVDLYAHGNTVRFSELTFTPGGGLVHIEPQTFAETMGHWFENT